MGFTDSNDDCDLEVDLMLCRLEPTLRVSRNSTRAGPNSGACPTSYAPLMMPVAASPGRHIVTGSAPIGFSRLLPSQYQ